MNTLSEERLKIAVFIDFDNIAIGVKQSLNRSLDIGAVLEAIKEKGEVVTKIAYGDWKRAEDYSRAMTQHAVQMVQRNLTPGGDKNGADIALALDALEMAFTRNHINTFVIVGGDSDFIALVEKLKQYDKTVFVVGGRAFTSVILQKNCHEFISYENLVGIQSNIRKSTGKAQIQSSVGLENALPLIRRALKILSDREVSPQLGLLKSTLLQLDSTFSERDYRVSSFREFVQKLANAGYIHLKQVDRSLIVELKESRDENGGISVAATESAQQESTSQTASQTEQTISVPQQYEATRGLLELLRDSKVKPHWPMYLRTFKQFLRSLQPSFDERQYGISSTYDLVRQAHRDGLLRVERNRQGILRIFPGERFPQHVQEKPAEETVLAEIPEIETAIPAQEQERQQREVEVMPDTSIPAPEIPAEIPEAVSPRMMPEENIPIQPAAEEKPKRRKKTASSIAATKPAKSGVQRKRPVKQRG
jgi:uncharacterized LabA/DUF88 family protein